MTVFHCLLAPGVRIQVNVQGASKQWHTTRFGGIFYYFRTL
jgi:hypothetical protein